MQKKLKSQQISWMVEKYQILRNVKYFLDEKM